MKIAILASSAAGSAAMFGSGRIAADIGPQTPVLTFSTPQHALEMLNEVTTIEQATELVEKQKQIALKKEKEDQEAIAKTPVMGKLLPTIFDGVTLGYPPSGVPEQYVKEFLKSPQVLAGIGGQEYYRYQGPDHSGKFEKHRMINALYDPRVMEATCPHNNFRDNQDVTNLKYANLMAEILKDEKFAHLWGKYSDMKTPAGFNFAQCAKTGIDNPFHPNIIPCGFVFTDEFAPDYFREFTDEMMFRRHLWHPARDWPHKPNLAGEVPNDLVDPTVDDGRMRGMYVKTARIRTGRSLKNFALPPATRFTERRELEQAVVKGLSRLGFTKFDDGFKQRQLPANVKQILENMKQAVDVKLIAGKAADMNVVSPFTQNSLNNVLRELPPREAGGETYQISPSDFAQLEADAAGPLTFKHFFDSLRLVLDLRGTYFPEFESQSMREVVRSQFPNVRDEHFDSGMSADIKEELLAKGNAFQHPDSTLLLSSGCGRHWPDARGIWENKDENLYVWINEEDHMRIVSMQRGGDFQEVWMRFITGLIEIDHRLAEQGSGYILNDRLGFLLTCPSNTGTGVRTGAHIRLKYLPAIVDGKHKARSTLPGSEGYHSVTKKGLKGFKGFCEDHRLQGRGTGGVDDAREGTIKDISNVDRIGYSERDLVTFGIKGMAQFVRLEMRYDLWFSIQNFFDSDDKAAAFMDMTNREIIETNNDGKVLDTYYHNMMDVSGKYMQELVAFDDSTVGTNQLTGVITEAVSAASRNDWAEVANMLKGAQGIMEAHLKYLLVFGVDQAASMLVEFRIEKIVPQLKRKIGATLTAFCAGLTSAGQIDMAAFNTMIKSLKNAEFTQVEPSHWDTLSTVYGDSKGSVIGIKLAAALTTDDVELVE